MTKTRPARSASEGRHKKVPRLRFGLISSRVGFSIVLVVVLFGLLSDTAVSQSKTIDRQKSVPLQSIEDKQDQIQKNLDRGIDPKRGVEFELLDITSDDFLKSMMDNQRRSKGEYVTDQAIDLDGDGKPDLALQSTFSRAGRGIHYVVHRVKGMGKTRILKKGLPLVDGREIVVKDLLSAVTEAHMCSVGGSLNAAHKDLPADTFCHGPWWKKKNRSLAFVIETGDKVQVGFIKLSFDNSGWTIGETKLSKEFGDTQLIEIDDMRP